MQYEIDVNGRIRRVLVHRTNDRFLVSVDGREWPVDAARIDPHTWSLLVESASHEVTILPNGAGQLSVRVGGAPMAVGVNGRRRRPGAGGAATGAGGTQRLTAPMPGKVVRLLVKPGEAVRARQPVVVIEAMKMENELRAAVDGVVADVSVRDGQSVEAGALLAVITPTTGSDA